MRNGWPDDHRMQRDAHDARLLGAVGEELLELVHHRAVVLLAGVALSHVERNVVDLHAIGDRGHLPALDLHRIGLIVVVPVAAIDHALFGQDVERVVGLGEPGAEPAARPLAGRLLDGLEHVADDLFLLVRSEARRGSRCWWCRDP